jgi:hypothetical protein
MESKAHKTSWIILLIVHCAVIIIGLILVFIPEFFHISEFEAFTGQKWSDFTALNAKVASSIIMNVSQMGLYILLLGFAALIVTLTAYQRGERWSWFF